MMLAAALALGAFLLPVRGAATVLVGPEAPVLGQVTAGLWIFKAMLLVHSAGILLLVRFAPRPDGGALMPLRRHAEPASRRQVILLSILLTVALGLRLYDLGDGLWFDEIQTLVDYVRLPLGQILATFDSQNQHMLYTLLARISFAGFGESPWALRLPAALLGVASLAALYWFAAQITARREAMLATLLLAFSYHHVWFSQNARGYTGLLLWTLLASGLFLRLLSDAHPRSWLPAVAYAASVALAIYTHATAVFLVVVHFLLWAVLALRARRRGLAASLVPLVGLVLAATFTLQLYALVLPQFLHTLLAPTMEGLATSWKNPSWFLAETLQVLARGVPGGLAAVALGLLVAIAGVVSYARQNPAIAGIMLGPALVTAAVLLSLEHNLWPRLFFFSAGFAVLIAVRGALSLGQALLASRGRSLAIAALLAVAAGSAFTVPGAYHPKQDYLGARDYVLRERTPGDAVVTVDMSAYVYVKYLEPEWVAVSDADQLAEIEAHARRTWLVYVFPTRLAAVRPDIWGRLQSDYVTAAEFPGTVGGGTVVVKVKP